MNQLPKRVYRVTVLVGDGQRLTHGEHGGGSYTAEVFARRAVREHRRRGRESHLFVSECVWQEIEP